MTKVPNNFADVTEQIRRKAKAAHLPRKWRTLPMTTKDKEYVRPLMTLGHSNKSAAEVLGLTEGQIAGIRHRQKIPSLNPTSFEAANAAKKAKRVHPVSTPTSPAITPTSIKSPPKDSVQQPVRAVQKLPIAATVEAPATVTHKLATVFNQCRFSGNCAYERLPGLTHCGRPGHDT